MGFIFSFTNLLFSPHVSLCLFENWQFVILCKKYPKTQGFYKLKHNILWHHSITKPAGGGASGGHTLKPVPNQSPEQNITCQLCPQLHLVLLPPVLSTKSLHCHSSRCLFHLENYRIEGNTLKETLALTILKQIEYAIEEVNF